MGKQSVGVKVAWIGFGGAILAAIIAALVSMFGKADDKASKQVASTTTTVGTLNGDVVNGNKIETQALPDLSDGQINLKNVAESGGLNFDKYMLFQSFKLNAYSNEMDGALLVLIDKRIPGLKGHLEYDGYERITEPSFEYDNSFEGFELNQLDQALLVIVNSRLKIIYTEQLGREAARLDRVFLYPDKGKATYVLTREYSIGMGSYNGPVSYFLEVSNGRINYLMDKDGLMTSLKSAWRIREVGDHSEIEYKTCRPNESIEFEIMYQRYYFDGSKWQSIKRKKSGFWEIEDRHAFSTEDFDQNIKN